MKKFILIIIFAFGSFCFAKAQDGDGGKRGEKIQALKIAFITQKLGLTAEEAQRFWPVYNQYQNEMKSAFKENRGEDVIEGDEKVLNIRKKYRPEFVKILGESRMNTFFSAEKEFRGVLLQQLKNRNNQQGPMLRRR
jgi:hypothetical protein